MNLRIGWLGLVVVIVAASLAWLLWLKPAEDARQQAAVLKRQMESEQRFAATAETVETKNGRVVKAYFSRISSEQSALCVADATELEEFGVALMARPDDELALALRNHTKLRRLSFLGPGITDRSLPVIGQLEQLEDLNLECTRITDDGLKHLAGLMNLRSLNLAGTDIRGPGVVHLASLPKLISLGLSDTLVDDAGLQSFRSLEHVQFLTLMQTKVRGPGLKHLAGMKKLSGLDLGRVPQLDAAVLAQLPQVQLLRLEDRSLSPQALSCLAALRGLKSLRLNDVRITDAHLVELTVAPRLRELHFHENELTESGLSPLEKCKGLQYLSLGRGLLDDEVIHRLSEKLPQTRIFWDGSKRLGPMP